jgi:hypothetical protein
MSAPMSERDLQDIERQLDGSEPYYLRELLAEIRRLRAALRVAR